MIPAWRLEQKRDDQNGLTSTLWLNLARKLTREWLQDQCPLITGVDLVATSPFIDAARIVCGAASM